MYQILREWLRGKRELAQAKRRDRRLKHAIEVANQMTKTDRKTRYIIEGQKEFMILSTNQIERMRRKQIFKPGFTILDIYKKSVYVATFNPEIAADWKKTRTKEKQRCEYSKPL